MQANGEEGNALALRVLDVVPRLMRVLRTALAADSAQPLVPSQFRLLRRIGIGCRLVSELADVTGVSSPTVSTAVDTLVRRGLVVRHGGACDRRTVPLSLSPEGMAVVAAAQARQVSAVEALLPRLDPAAQRALGVALDALAQVLDAESCPPPVPSPAGAPVPAPTPDRASAMAPGPRPASEGAAKTSAGREGGSS